MSFSWSSFFTQSNGHHQVESHIRKKLDSLLKESRIGDKEDSDSFSIRALLRATHQGLQKNLRQVLVQAKLQLCEVKNGECQEDLSRPPI